MPHIRYALRTLRLSPGFTVTAIAALALGIGAGTAIFSVVNKVLLEPLPYPEPDHLVQIRTVTLMRNEDQDVVSIPKYITWRDYTNTFEYMAAYDINGLGVTLGGALGSDDAIKAAHVSADYFPLFGAAPALGRTFSRQEDRPDGPRVAVISDNLWRRRFGGDRAIIDRIITLDREAYRVIGVLAPGFGADPPADLWLPLEADPSSTDHVSRVRVAARIKPGFSFDEAQRDLGKAMGRFFRRHPGAPVLPMEHVAAIPLRDAVVGNVRMALFLLTGAVAFVLLISCANVANLLLARATRRAREIAIRAALGAARKQIVAQLLIESLLLSLAGGALGLALGYVGVRELLAMSPGDLPRIGANGAAIALDWRVFLFTLIVSAGAGILFGLLPALDASRADVSTLVKDTPAQSGMGLRRNRGRAALVIVEMALAMILLAGAGLLIRTFVAMRTVNRGFDEQNVLTLEMSLNSAQFEKTANVAKLVRAAERRIKRIDGVSAVGTTCALPLEPSFTMPFIVFGRDLAWDRYHGTAVWRSVSPAYFDAFRIRLLLGRLFTDADNEHAAGVVVINRAMVKKYWQEVDANPIGQFLTIGKGMGPVEEQRPREIIGVVVDVRDSGLNREPAMFVPVSQTTDGMTARNSRLLPMTWVIRAAPGQPLPMGVIRQELREASGGMTLQRIRTMHEIVAASSARTQFYTTLLGVFAGIALVLAAVGLYGVMAYTVQQRTQEIGIRMAVGAGPEDVRNMVVWQGMRLALMGIGIGVPAALALTRVMDSLIFGIRTWDPVVFGLVAVLLGVVGLFATYVPSLRATRVDPVDALRC
jgi:putative ABC transport system permease protein